MTMRWIDGGNWKEPQRVGDGGATATDPSRDLVVGEPKILDELLVRGCLLQGAS